MGTVMHVQRQTPRLYTKKVTTPAAGAEWSV
jgi:hypothetical protein